MEGGYFDPEFETLLERIHSPRACIDNDTCEDCTLVKVDSANRHGILLKMVQVLTDLDLVISKSYISSDGGWLMDVFHVTDHTRNKLTDPALIRFIQQSLYSGRRVEEVGSTGEVTTCLGKLIGPSHLVSDYMALEVTATDRPGLLSEISAVLTEFSCHVVSAQAWTHNYRAACIMYLVDEESRQPISNLNRLGQIKEQIERVVSAVVGEQRWHVRLSGPMAGRIHAERRLHQLMHEDCDYEAGSVSQPVDDSCQLSSEGVGTRRRKEGRTTTQVSIESWKEKGYSVVNIRSKDRPKLLFDTVCALTDMQYVVFHATVSSHDSLAIQEYYIRHMDGCTLESEAERQQVTRCLVAAVERRISHGLRLDVRTRDQPGLLSDITRAFRESGISLARAECTTQRDQAVGTFFVRDASSGEDVSPRRLEAVRLAMGGSIKLEVNSSQDWPPIKSTAPSRPSPSRGVSRKVEEEERSKVSFGSLVWSHIERFSSNFGSIRS